MIIDLKQKKTWYLLSKTFPVFFFHEMVASLKKKHFGQIDTISGQHLNLHDKNQNESFF